MEIVTYAIEQGINLIDTSNSYAHGQAESIIGKALKENGMRNEILIASKFYYPTGEKGVNNRGSSRKHIFKACEDSLRRLGVDCIDLYQMHRTDMHIPLLEMMQALSDLVRQGKIRYWGTTTSPAWKIAEASMLAEYEKVVAPISEQLPYNLLDRRAENEIIPACQWADRGILTWSPLAMGMLTGRYSMDDPASFDTPRFNRGGIYAQRMTREAVQTGNQFARIASEYGLKPAHFALLWVKDQPGVTAPICGPRTLAQIKDVVPLMQQTFPKKLELICDQLSKPGGHVANFFNTANWMAG